MNLNTTPNISLSGYVKNNVIILDDNIQLPEGMTVKVIVPHSAANDLDDETGQRFEFETVTINLAPGILGRLFGEMIPKLTSKVITNTKRHQARCQSEDLGKGVTLEMVYIPGGRFVMGSPDTEEGRWRDGREGPQHRVTVQPFLMGKYPVTQAQWQAVMGDNPSQFKGDQHPVEYVSYDEVVAFCQRLSQKTGHDYRLPSEAQWEYACRAGTSTPFYFGDTITTDLANYNGNYTYASGPKGVYRDQTTQVGQFPPNAFGLYDMHGNVWEWCADWWHDSYQDAPIDGRVWEADHDSGRRVFRGGAWYGEPGYVRAAFRHWDSHDGRSDNVGFRLARLL